MNTNKLLRDVFVLFAFCGLFFLATKAVNLLGQKRADASEEKEFSPNRLEADRHYNGDDFEAAIPFLEKLVEEDKYNSHAWFRLGRSYARLLMQNSRPTLANNFTPYTQEQIDEFSASGIKALNNAAEYPRYKGLSYKNLALVYAVKRDREMTLQSLRSGIREGGFAPTSQLRLYGVFSFLYDDEEYLKIERSYFRRWWWRNQRALREREEARESQGTAE